MKRQVAGILGFASFVLAGCAAALPPMPQPEVGVSYTWTGLRNGKPRSYTIVSDSGDAWDWESSSGCKFTRSKTRFAPSTKWSNCGVADGQQTSTLIGEIWPLEVGKRWSFDYSGSNTKGITWEAKRNCEVESRANVQTALGPTDTYKVVCRDKWNVRTFYISPEMKEYVFWEKYRKSKNKRSNHEITAAN